MLYFCGLEQLGHLLTSLKLLALLLHDHDRVVIVRNPQRLRHEDTGDDPKGREPDEDLSGECRRTRCPLHTVLTGSTAVVGK